MSPDTNNNLEIEQNDDEEDDNDDDDEEEDEPVFKFSSIIDPSKLRSATATAEDNRRFPLPDFSCLAVNERFLVIGRMTGDLLITDHLGHEMPHFQMKAHDYPVNAISIDDAGEFIGSCCQGGKVKISGLLGKDNDQLFSFSRPVRAVCLDPNFSKTKMFVTGITNVILNERGTFGRHKQSVLIELGGGLIHTLKWKDAYIAFANDKGVGIFDLQTRRLLGYEEISGPKEMAPGLFPSQISWNDSTTLAIACAQTIRITKIVTEAVNAHQSSSIKKYLNTIYTFKIEFFACGLTSVAGDLILLGIEQFNTTDGSVDPSLTILSKNEKKYAEKAHDPFHLQHEKETNPSQFHLEYLADENSFFILSPYEIIKAERRDFDDHIDFLLAKKRFEEAIKIFEKPPRRDAVAKRHTQKSVYRAYVQYLMENNQIEQAVKFFERIYTTANEWEEQIRSFIQRNKLDLIVPHIPTETLKLSPEIYELVLQTYLDQKEYQKFLELLKTWPTDLYSLSSIDQKIRLATDDQRPSKILLECSAVVAEKQGNVSRTLDILLKMGNVQVFQLIERKKLHGSVLPHIERLMLIDENITVDMLMKNIDQLPVNAVVDSLGKSPRYLHKYLDAVFTHNPNDSREFHTRQVSLYAEFEPAKLMQFLRKAGNYNVQEALAICEQQKLHREMVFLYGRAGNGTVALRIILNELKDIQLAISFCRETGSKGLWESLIQQSRDKPEYIKGLLDHAGSDVDLKDLIDQMRSDLVVPGLRDSLCKIMQDHNIQMSLSECCRKIIVHDCLALRKQTVTLLQHGYLVRDSDVCSKCHNPLYTAGHTGNPQVSVFYCLHVFHGKCIENQPDVCGVCSTRSLFPTS